MKKRIMVTNKLYLALFILLLGHGLAEAQIMQMELDGALKIGTYSGVNPSVGTIRWNPSTSDFEGWNGTAWRSMTSSLVINDSGRGVGGLSNERWTNGPLWSIDGNTGTSQYISTPRLGTTDNAPLVFITNNIERLRIKEDGTLIMEGSLDVGEDAIIGMDLDVKKDVHLNIDGGTTRIDGAATLGGSGMNTSTFTGAVQMNKTLNVDGNTTLNGINTFGGSGMKLATFTGAVKMNKTLDVDGITSLNNKLDVDGATTLNSTLDVDLSTTLNSSLNVTGATSLSSSLTVKTLTVDSMATIKDRLHVVKSDTTHVAIFQNNDEGDGDGIVIKLGKAKTEYDLEGVYSSLPEDVRASIEGRATATSEAVKKLLNCEITPDAKLNVLGDIVVEGALDDLKLVAGLSVGLANALIGVLNLELGLPYDISVPINASLDLVSCAVTDGINDGLDLAANTVTTGINSSIDVALNGVTVGINQGLGSALTATTSGINNHVNSALSSVTTGLNSHVNSALSTVTNGVNGILPGIGSSVSGGINSGLTNLTGGITSSLNSQLAVFDIGSKINSSLGLPVGLSFAQILNGFCDICVEDPDDGQPWPSVPLIPGMPSLKLPTLTSFPFTPVSALNLTGLSPLSVNPLSSIGVSALNVINIPDLPLIDVPDLPLLDIPDLPKLDIPDLPKVEIPAIPIVDIAALGIDPINLTDLDFWGIPNICLTETGSSPLNNRNEFITFTDKNDKKMGSIKAVSITDWSRVYLNPIFMYGLSSAITESKVDKAHGRYHFSGEISKALLAYATIGVEYRSGNGDYAEWLERIDPRENINAGDIVGVIGGKITKDIEHAEQVMAVSHFPIILGNIPDEDKIYLGNNVAFMGQVPVKIMGTVKTGDYIVANRDTPGYGVAISPNDMSIVDFKYVVGRAWEEDLSEGMKMINTVIGVHNGDYIKILKNYEEKFKASEKRFEDLEAKVDRLVDLVNSKS